MLYLDDDHVPNRYLVQAHALRTAERAADRVVRPGRNRRERRSVPPHDREPADPSRRVHVPSGVGSVSVGVARLRVAALAAKVAAVSPMARMADDIVFGDWFARLGLPVHTLGQDHLLKVQPHATDAWALHLSRRDDCTTAPDARYGAVIEELNARFEPLRPLLRPRAGRSRVKIWKPQQVKR